MNSFLTFLVRQDHSVQLAVHLAAGILSLVLLTGAAQPRKDRAQEAAKPAIELTVAPTPAMIVAGR